MPGEPPLIVVRIAALGSPTMNGVVGELLINTVSVAPASRPIVFREMSGCASPMLNHWPVLPPADELSKIVTLKLAMLSSPFWPHVCVLVYGAIRSQNGRINH